MQQLLSILKKHWGYDTFLPLQQDAMNCVMEGRDSVVVLPTGGGKSLCYQAPAMLLPGMAVVVSPLISLMKDQVDALTDCGVPAACLNSSLAPDERQTVFEQMRAGKLKLLYLAPERLVAPGFIDTLRSASVSFFAIDEAHCISAWGHDFRPEYRALRILKATFPKLSVHGYTATATERVRADISAELDLRRPAVHVGSFDRTNLVYRVTRRVNKWAQIADVIERHKGESGIIYCISRKNVEELCGALQENGYKALPYHAGMEDRLRKRNQEAFTKDKADIIVATVAFGMGIDKSNVRYIIHAGAPKSVEHYQQETGRAGRDGLEAECVLLYAGGDFALWRQILSKNESEDTPNAFLKLGQMEDYCNSVQCRHAALVRYFGQAYEKEQCRACDVCLSEIDLLGDPLPVAQKILSCVVRLKERFGADHTADVLAGSKSVRVLELKHDKLSTYGAMSGESKRNVRLWIEQLINQDCLERDGEFKTLRVTPKGWKVIKGAEKPKLSLPAEGPVKTTQTAVESWQGVDEGLFEQLRVLRKQIADEKEVPAFVVFSDATLREMARRRPSTTDGFLKVSGVGMTKCDEYGARFLETITTYCRQTSIPTDIEPSPSRQSLQAPRSFMPPASISQTRATKMFREGLPVGTVAHNLGRAESTTYGYLEEYIVREKVTSVQAWVDDGLFHRIADVAAKCGADRIKPIFDDLGGTVSYGLIRITVACLRNQAYVNTGQEGRPTNRK